MHIDTDEANAGLIQQGAKAEIVNASAIESLQPIERQAVVKTEEKSMFHFDKKLLSQGEVLAIDAQEIIVSKKTIVTALAYDKIRELNKTLTISTG